MGELSDKAQEFAGRAKEAAGDVTGNDDLRTEGTADRAEAEVKQKVDEVTQAVTEKASDVADSVQDKAAEVKHAVAETASDSRLVPALAVVGAVLVAALLLRRRSRTSSSSQRRTGRKGRAVATKAVTAGLKEAVVR